MADSGKPARSAMLIFMAHLHTHVQASGEKQDRSHPADQLLTFSSDRVAQAPSPVQQFFLVEDCAELGASGDCGTDRLKRLQKIDCGLPPDARQSFERNCRVVASSTGEGACATPLSRSLQRIPPDILQAGRSGPFSAMDFLCA